MVSRYIMIKLIIMMMQQPVLTLVKSINKVCFYQETLKKLKNIIRKRSINNNFMPVTDMGLVSSKDKFNKAKSIEELLKKE